MRIIGAGLSGLLCGNLLRRFKPVIHEAQSTLPNNHGALLRFRSEICSKATGIPFKEVTVHKAVSHKGQLLSQSTIALNNAYSQKVTGKIVDRSIISLETVKRYIAPLDFISQMAKSCEIVYNSKVGEELRERTPDSEPMISTMPMPMIMDFVGWKDKPEFVSRKIWAINAQIDNCDVYQTVYYPGEELYYRASLTGNKLTIECLFKPFESEKIISYVAHDFGLPIESVKGFETSEQKYGKLQPVADPALCRRFILFLTDRYRIYSLGRFALWRPILQDDVAKDCGVIEKLIEFRDDYRKALINSQ